MEIRRFGPGHRRPEGPPGTSGLTGQVIHSDERGVVTELAFSRRGVIAPHSNPDLTLFVVISGGGFVQVGDERLRVNHGEAVVWPPNVPHGAYTEGSEMRAIVIELPESVRSRTFEGIAIEAGERQLLPASRAEGSLVTPDVRREDHDESEGEPW